MEVTIKAKPSRKPGYVRFYANTNLILSVEVEVYSYVELEAKFERYCNLVLGLGHTVIVGDINLYLVFLTSRPMPEQKSSNVHISEVAFWSEDTLAQQGEPWVPEVAQPVLKLHKGDRAFLKSLKIAVED